MFDFTSVTSFAPQFTHNSNDAWFLFKKSLSTDHTKVQAVPHVDFGFSPQTLSVAWLKKHTRFGTPRHLLSRTHTSEVGSTFNLLLPTTYQAYISFIKFAANQH